MTRKASLKSKLVRSSVLLLSMVTIVTLLTVAGLQYKDATKNLEQVELQIKSALATKGQLLSENHALALKGLVADNAFSEVAALVTRGVAKDEDVVYGLFLDPEGTPWAYVAPAGEPLEGQPIKTSQVELDNERWEELKITEEEYEVEEFSSRELALYNHSIVEFIAPVIDEDELLGTIRYGLSTVVMKQLLAEARETAKNNLIRMLSILAGLGLAVGFMGILVSRRTATAITKPLGSLTVAAQEIAGGDRTVRVDIDSGDEIEVLGGTFNRMIEELDATYANLEELNASLERRVEERTAELAARNRDMRLVFDNVDQGFLMLNPKGEMASERSAFVDKKLGVPEPKETFWHFLGKSSQHLGEWFELAWESIDEGIMPLEVCLAQLPPKARINDRFFRIDYIPVIPDDDPENIQGMLVIVTDETAELAQKKADLEQREMMAIFTRFMRDKSGFLDFYKDACALEKRISGKPEEREQDTVILKRIVHTLKGNASIMGLGAVGAICHEMESFMEESGQDPEERQRQDLSDRWAKVKGTVQELLGGDQAKIEVDEDEYSRVLAAIWDGASEEELARMIINWKLEPVSKPLKRLAENAAGLANRLGKGDVMVDVECEEDIRLDPNTWSTLWQELVHVIRNAVDHGIETNLEREKQGKGQARLFLGAQRDESNFRLLLKMMVRA